MSVDKCIVLRHPTEPMVKEKHAFNEYGICECGLFRDNRDGTYEDLRTGTLYPWVKRGVKT